MSLHLRLHYPLSREKQAELGVLLWDGYGSFPLGGTQVSGEPAKLVFVKCGRVDFCTLERFTPACPPFARIFEKGMRQMRFVSWGVKAPCSVSTLDFVWFIPQGTAGDGEGLLSLRKSQNSLTTGQGLNPPVEPGKKVPCPGLLMSCFQEE